ncbi:chemotaxis protein [alpha proteobacterium AAP81b]|nr:chemotaxis protein [alpha proteobacterium AAP81b]
MTWYREIAPIRQKMLINVIVMTMLSTLAAVGGSLGTVFGGLAIGLGLGLLAAILSLIIGTMFRAAVSDPYVATVVRMEALAAGDLTSPIEFTNYQDCVGRLTRAMFSFRDAAIKLDRAGEVKMVIDDLGANLADLSNCDLTGRITADYPDDFAVLKNNYNDALDKVRTTVQQVSESAIAIKTGSAEIAQASEDLARRTESNAASLEETSAALVQIDSRIKDSAAASVSTVARADQAMVTVGSGRTTADAAKQAMERVSGSAKGIDSVIEGLDKIAFQTRVLAMNAAVEAGRAGDAGRGFAVVADLVSALAMRAEEEAKRARDQLTVTQSEIFTAVAAVEKVDVALSTILDDVSEVNKLLAGMANDNQAQSMAISEITAAVATMDRSTQQNAAMVEETSAAARNLTQEVGTLANAAAQFKFERRVRNMPVASDRRSAGRAAPPSPAPAAIEPSAPPRLPVATVKSVRAGNGLAVVANNEWADF